MIIRLSYLVDSPDKQFDGESLRCYKDLGADQVFEERRIHSVEFCSSWPVKSPDILAGESPLCFIRGKCYPRRTAVSNHTMWLYVLTSALASRMERTAGACLAWEKPAAM